MNEQMWKPIETVPKDGSIIDLWENGRRYANCRWKYWDEDGGWEQEYSEVEHCWHNRDELHPTHWMPLPSPPIEGDFKRVDVLENQEGIYGIVIGNRRVRVFTISRDKSL